MSYVGNIKSGDNIHLVGSTLYGTCNTAADVTAKVVVLSDFNRLLKGVTIHVEFTDTNTAENPTLNVNDTGAISIIGNSNWKAGTVVSFTYNGTNWCMNDIYNISLATENYDGLLSASDKRKLDKVPEEGATNYEHPTSGVEEGTYGVIADTPLELNFGDTFEINGITVDDEGHVTEAGSHTIKLPTIGNASSSSAGLMTPNEKAKVDKLPEDGNYYTHPTSGVAANTYGTNSSTALTPAFGSTFSVDGFAVDSQGHITSASTHTVKIPDSTATETSSGLMSADDKKTLNGLASSPTINTFYGTCDTIASTATKVVVCSDFDKLSTGATIHVKFTNSNTNASPTLNVNSKGAKTIYRYGTTKPGTDSSTSWEAGAVVSFTYDGNYWIMNDAVPVSAGGVGESTKGVSVTLKNPFDNTSKTMSCLTGAERFNDYTNNIAYGQYSVAMGNKSTAEGNYSFVAGYSCYALNYGVSFGNASRSHMAAFSSGYSSYADGNASVAMGNNCKATGISAVALGNDTTAASMYSMAIGGGSKALSGGCAFAGGSNSTASGDCAFAFGANAQASNQDAIAMGQSAKATNAGSVVIGTAVKSLSANGVVLGTLNKVPDTEEDTGDIFIIGNGTEETGGSNALRIDQDASVMATNSYTAQGADYAEMFEWLDGNPDNEDRRGMFVTLDGDKIRIASNEDKYILGVVSASPSVVANAHTDAWCDKYLRDEFGDYRRDENNKRILNPEFKLDNNNSYVSRLDRKEWSAIGMLGVLCVRQDGTAQVNGYVSVNDDGIATSCDEDTPRSYRVIKVKSDNVCMIVFR